MTPTISDSPGLVGRMVSSFEQRQKALFRRRHWLRLIDRALTVALRFLIVCALFAVALVTTLACLAFALR